MRLGKLLLPFLLLMSLSGCVTLPAGPSVTMAPASGKPFDLFESEFGKCKQLADRQMGKSYEYSSTQEAQLYYDNIYVRCMTAYGNRIQQPVRVYRTYRISPPEQPPGYNAVPPPGTPPPDYAVPPPDTPPPGN